MEKMPIIEVRRGMAMSVYRDARGTDCTNGGITSKVTDVVVTGTWADGAPIPEIFEPKPHCPEFKIGVILGCPHAYPVDGKHSKMVGWMFGGNFIHSSDSRCPQQPIQVHDRQETQQQNDLLST